MGCGGRWQGVGCGGRGKGWGAGAGGKRWGRGQGVGCRGSGQEVGQGARGRVGAGGKRWDGGVNLTLPIMVKVPVSCNIGSSCNHIMAKSMMMPTKQKVYLANQTLCLYVIQSVTFCQCTLLNYDVK